MLQMDLNTGVNGAGQAARQIRRNVFTLVSPECSLRESLESRVRSGFGQHFGACIEGFMPTLAWYQHRNGGTGIIGVRRASDEPLFLEHYLDIPVETAVSEASGVRVARDRIAEVGQFVVDDREIAGSFFRDLVPFLRDEGFDWVCFTGTNRVRAIIERVGFCGFPLANAAADRAAPTHDRWGSYYEHEPVVMIGKLDDPKGGWLNAAGRASVCATG